MKKVFFLIAVLMLSHGAFADVTIRVVKGASLPSVSDHSIYAFIRSPNLENDFGAFRRVEDRMTAAQGSVTFVVPFGDGNFIVGAFHETAETIYTTDPMDLKDGKTYTVQVTDDLSGGYLLECFTEMNTPQSGGVAMLIVVFTCGLLFAKVLLSPIEV